MSGPSAGSRGGPRKGRVQGCGRVWRSRTGRGRTRRGRYQPGLGLRVLELDRDRKRRPRREAQPAHGHSVGAAGRGPRPLCPRPCRRCSRAPGEGGGGEALMQRPQDAALRRDKRTVRTAPAWPSPGRRPVRPSEPVLGHRGPSVPGHLALPAPHAPGATPLCSLRGSSAEHRAGAPQASAHPGFEPASPRDMHGSPSLPLAGPAPTPSLGSHGAPSRRRPSPHLQASKRL